MLQHFAVSDWDAVVDLRLVAVLMRPDENLPDRSSSGCILCCSSFSNDHESNDHEVTPTSTPDKQQSSGLPTGTKAGIGIAIPVVVLLLVGALFWLWRRQRRSL
jgi:hypothetical protein